jgi:N-acetylglucosamine kinase-like BadF-type ATPase
MTIIVESGATKTSWRALCDDGSVRAAQTAGLSPTCLDDDHIRGIMREAMPVLNPEGRTVSRVYFYGAGLVSPEAAAPVQSALEMWCPFAQVEFHSDIVAAARALWGDGSGVVAIMGTGSNSCLYEGGQIVSNIRPGGYILGDEGSGVALGRAFLADFVKGLLPADVEADFVREFSLDYSQIVCKVYKEQAASAFMASFAPFILSHSHDPYIKILIQECLESFVKRSLARYAASAEDAASASKVGVVGSFGCACEDMLRQIGERYGIEFVKFIKSPVEELVKYHSNNGL